MDTTNFKDGIIASNGFIVGKTDTPHRHLLQEVHWMSCKTDDIIRFFVLHFFFLVS